MENVAATLESLVRETQKPETEVMTLAFRSGLRQLWREHVLGQYLRGQVSREEAIKQTGIDWVELAERQRKAVQEDLQWAMDR